MKYEKINASLHRLILPYKDIFTTVYAVEYGGGVILFDTATTEEDSKELIIPMLTKLGLADKLKYIFVSHDHKDHSGGVPYLAERFPDAVILTRSPSLRERYCDLNVKEVSDGDDIDGAFTAVAVPGHSLDSAILYDKENKIAITGDSLQLYGIFGSDYWGSNIALHSEYLAAIRKLSEMDIEAIYTAHDFHPHGYAYVGREQVALALRLSEEPIFMIRKAVAENIDRTDAQIMELYNSSAKVPPVREGVFRKMREYILAGRI